MCVFSGKGQSVKAGNADQRAAQRGNSGSFQGFCLLFGVWRLFVCVSILIRALKSAFLGGII